MEKKQIKDSVLIGEWKEVIDLELSTITKRDEDTTRINGLVIRGYETKFNNGTNTNYERYEKGCFDEFIENYFIKNKLNIPVTILHKDDIDHLAGRVIYMEENATGFYFVVYIPKTYVKYEAVKAMISEGVLQGFSKTGWATDYEEHYNERGEWEFELIKKMELINVSIVDTPANGISFEKIGEKVEDATRYANKNKKENNASNDWFEEMFK